MAQRMGENIKNRDIVFVGLQAWDEPTGANCKDLARQFSLENRVLYVNFPLNRQAQWQKKPDAFLQKRLDVLSGRTPELTRVHENFWVMNPKTVLEPSNWMPIPLFFNALTYLNNWRFARRIRQQIAQLHFTNIILFNDQDIYRGYYLPELLKPNRFIYYIRDNLIGVEFFKRHGTRLEPRLIKKANLVVCNSTYLTRYALKFSAKSYYVGQGCDLNLFTPRAVTPMPPMLHPIQPPIIGYVGALVSHRLDRDLLQYLSDHHPHWNVVLIGPEDDGFVHSPLHDCPNVTFLGSRPMEELPSYIQFFDVCINPQLLNEITIGNYPRKVDEYLAMGKPVVAVKTVAMEEFSDFTYLAETYEEFGAQIEKALREDTPARASARMRFASLHTWENSFQSISAAFFTEEVREADPIA